MKTLLCLLAILIFPLTLCSDAASVSAKRAGAEDFLLQSELVLAKKPIIYFVFNLKDRVVLLKSRGIALRQMKIEDVSFWGDAVDSKPLLMIRKSALFEPERVKIDPDKNKEEENNTATTPAPGAFDIEALELQDMPTSYRMEFGNGVHISVRPEKAGFVSGVYRAADYSGWYLSRPILTLWNSFRGRPFTSIYLTVNEEDARSIYWSLVEGSENIIYHGPSTP
ncbi:MAG: hypothetical protein C4526_04305 [Nitrospiraceae bacterium]|nr:MAG: hypothetical protein C4526_04305 [Nitrospiraceae bacterium]